MRTTHIALTLVLVLSAAAFAEDPRIITHPVNGNISMLEGQGGNIGVSAGEDGLLIIDTQYANMAEPIVEALHKLSDGPLKFVINTHFHGDHTGGNAALAQDATVVAQTNVRTRLLMADKDLSDATFRHSLPSVTFDQNASIHFNGEELKLVHLEHGHTDGDSIIFFTKSQVVHTGDQFTNGMYPYIDLANGGDVQAYLNNVGKMLDLIPDSYKIIPGHGPIGTKEDLRTFQAMLQDTVDIVRKGIAAGKDREALVKEGLPEKYKSAGDGFVSTQRWVSIVYQSYTR